MNKRKATEIRVDFSLKREVFFVVIGAMLGAVSMLIPTAFEVRMGLPYYITWVAFGHVVGVYSSDAAFAGIAIHTITAISIGIVIGVFLYKTGILNISKISNGLLYGLFAGSVVLVVFFIPIYFLILLPEINRTLSIVMPTTNDEYGTTLPQYSFPLVLVSYVIMHLVFGITVGLTSSTLSIKFGSRYRCSKCDISFSRIDSYQKHLELIHGEKPIQLTRILILGGGFAGIEVLRELQKAFQNDIAIDITLVSRDNFFLFTPMLPEISSGMIETRHIVTPLRVFCHRAKFYESDVESIDMDNKQVVISHRIGKQTNPIEWRSHILKYDYLVIALGSETNFFGMDEAAKQAFTLKSLGDAIVLRNHVINMLEQADIEHEDLDLRKSLLTFVVVGGGFSGVEIVGELNDFVLDSIKYFYHNLQKTYTKVVLVNSGQRILPEVTEELAEFALEKIRHKYIPPETIGAYGRSEYPARFFHVSVKNLHKDVSARNCVAYLERYNILDRTTSEETNSRLLVHEPVELKWKGMITQSVLIPPNTNRKFDALFLYDNLPHLPHIGVNSFLADLSDYSFKLRGVGSYELDYIVYSDNFPAIRSTYVLEVDQELSKTRFYRKQK